MKKVFMYFILLALCSTIVQPKRTIEKRVHETKKHKIIHKPIKPHLISRHKKHDIFTLAAPPSISSLLPSASHMTLMPNGVPNTAGEYIHHLIHRHPLNIPVYHGLHGIHPIYLPQHYGPLGPFGHRMFYRNGPWRHGFGYGVRYPYAHGFTHDPWYSSFRHGYGYPYNRLWHGLHFGHVPAGYGFGHGYGHGYHGNWFHSMRGWYPYSFDHSVDLRGDSGPDTMFVERSSIPAASKSSSLGSKINHRRLLKPQRKSLLTKRMRLLRFPVSHPRSYRGFSLRRNVIPVRFRFQRFKIRLSPLKRMLKRSGVNKKSRLQKIIGRSKHSSSNTT